MLKVVIIEDEEPILELTKLILGRNSNLKVVSSFSNGKDALGEISKYKPDVVFLDIEMPEMNGLELAEEITKISDDIQIVFVTAYEHYALNAFKVNAVNYILKPISEEEVNVTTERLLKKHNLLKHKQALNTEYKITCLGEFKFFPKLCSDPIKWPTAKVEELLAYFICYKNQKIDKWKLCDILWPEMSPEKAEHNLHSTIYRLKSTLKKAGIESIICYEKGMYMAQLNHFNCDLFKFQDYINDKETIQDYDMAETEEILKLYKGNLFGDKNYNWSINFCQEINIKYIRILTFIAQKYISEKDYIKAEKFLKQILEADPLNEKIYELLMLVHFYMGERARIVTQYEQMKRLLKNELGLSPKYSTKQLYEDLLTQLS